MERPFQFVETNLLSGREFGSLAHLNEVAAWWLREMADVREHRQTRRRPIDMHTEELSHLIPLPERPYELAEVVYRTVYTEGFVAYAQNRYSMPWRYIGQTLPVRITETELVIYSPQVEELARHPLWPAGQSGQQSLQTEHQPRRDSAERLEVLRERYAQLGEAPIRFLDGLVGLAPMWQGCRSSLFVGSGRHSSTQGVVRAIRDHATDNNSRTRHIHGRDAFQIDCALRPP